MHTRSEVWGILFFKGWGGVLTKNHSTQLDTAADFKSRDYVISKGLQ